MAEFEDRSCPACGAPLVGGSNFCEYCQSDWTPAKSKNPQPEIRRIDLRKYTRTPSGQRMLFFFILVMFAPAAPIYMWFCTDWTLKTKILVTLLFLAPVIIVIVAMVGTALLGMLGSVLF